MYQIWYANVKIKLRVGHEAMTKKTYKFDLKVKDKKVMSDRDTSSHGDITCSKYGVLMWKQKEVTDRSWIYADRLTYILDIPLKFVCGGIMILCKIEWIL